MHLIINDYLSPTELAKIYKKKSGEIGVNRNHIYDLIKREMKNQNSTDIDVIELPGAGDKSVYFVRQKNITVESIQLKKDRETLKAIERGQELLREAKENALAILATKDMSKKGKSSKGL
jgi:hypothetical protein